VDGDLRHDVRCSTESVNPEAAPASRHPVGTVSDQASTEQWRDLGVAVLGGQRNHEPRIGDDPLGVSAVTVIAGELRTHAEILAAADTESADAARESEPGHTHTIADFYGPDPCSDALDRSHDFVARHNRHSYSWQLVVDYVKIRSAYAAGTHPYDNLIGSWLRGLSFDGLEPSATAICQHHRTHMVIVVARPSWPCDCTARSWHSFGRTAWLSVIGAPTIASAKT
jgi:hypothetical protein